MRTFKSYRLYLISLLFIIQLSQYSCSSPLESYKNVSGKTDTLIIVHEECTECTDARITKGNITFPNYVNLNSLYSAGKEVILVGKSPYKDAEIGEEIFNYNIEIEGYFTTIDTTNAWGDVAVFCITEWKKLSKRNTVSN